MTQKTSSISLNFFPLTTQDFSFTVYRKKVSSQQEKRPFNDCKRWNLPEVINQDIKIPYISYWSHYEAKENFKEFICNQSTNNDLTKHYLFHLLKQKCKELGADEFEVIEHKFSPRIEFFIQSHPNNRFETVWLEPFLLREYGQFGFLADFRLRLPSGERMTGRDLELSLTHKGRTRNRDFYLDRFEKLKIFVSKFHGKLFPLNSERVEIQVEKNLKNLQAEFLNTKTYVFANSKESSSQIGGIRNYSPLSKIVGLKKIYFVYRPQDKPYSYELYRALQGKSFQQTFAGMESIFKFKLGNDTVAGIPVNSFEDSEIEKVAKQIPKNADGKRDGVPILLVPFNKLGSPKDKENYYRLKHKFLEYGIASQCVTLTTLKSENTLKWSVGNIGLQVFAKLGGEPWKVRPANKKCLIIGIGQAHRKETIDVIDNEETQESHEEFKIIKSFAYTVLTDSSGIYKELKIISSGEAEEDYLKNLKKHLKEVIASYSADYDKFVIHTTFSINKREINVIKKLIDELTNESQEKEFVVMKFNDENKYFGYASENNSLVPYESSLLRLSLNEYLVWFEGLQLQTSSSPKRIEKPVHIEFLTYPESFSDLDRKSYLQDALNLSGANWRGFNAKSFPVSVFYAKEIARYIKSFREYGLDENKVNWDGITPWFL
jgi:Piwi domain